MCCRSPRTSRESRSKTSSGNSIWPRSSSWHPTRTCCRIPENVSQAIVDELAQVHCYPDSDNYYLRQRIAEYNGLRLENVIVGAGSVEIIQHADPHFSQTRRKGPDLGKDLLALQDRHHGNRRGSRLCRGADGQGAALRPGGHRRTHRRATPRSSLSPTPTTRPGLSSMPRPSATSSTASPATRSSSWTTPTRNTSTTRTITSPAWTRSGRRKNVVVLRTFSKVYGLAGLRVGYAMAKPEIISILNRVKAAVQRHPLGPARRPGLPGK